MTDRMRALSEAEAYARCYGVASYDVRIVKIPRRPRYELRVSGEDLRRAFAARLDEREPEGDELEAATGAGGRATDEPSNGTPASPETGDHAAPTVTHELEHALGQPAAAAVTPELEHALGQPAAAPAEAEDPNAPVQAGPTVEAA